VAAINRIIGGLSERDHVRFLDIGAKFLTPEGLIQPEIMPDYLHPSVRGFEIWAQAIQAPLASLLGLQG
jgi:beta-glucosidase